jgi:hypothetical protein
MPIALVSRPVFIVSLWLQRLGVCLRRMETTASLLHHMRQLVRQQTPPGTRSRRELACSEDNVISHGVGVGAHCLCRFSGVGIRMDPNAAEVAPCIRRPGWSAHSALSHRVGLFLELIVRSADSQARRHRRGSMRVCPHLTEVATKTRLHKGARGIVERLTGRAKHFLNNRRRKSRRGW